MSRFQQTYNNTGTVNNVSDWLPKSRFAWIMTCLGIVGFFIGSIGTYATLAQIYHLPMPGHNWNEPEPKTEKSPIKLDVPVYGPPRVP